MTKRLLASCIVVLGIASCSPQPTWLRGDTANGALFVGGRPEGEAVRVSIRATRRGWVFLSLTVDSPDGGSFPVDPPIAVTMSPSELTGPPFELATTDVNRKFFPIANGTCSPCDLDLDVILKRDVPSGTPTIPVRWTLTSSIMGEEERAPENERVTIVFR